MPDSAISQLFASPSYAAFAQVVGKYRHDLLNRQGNVQLSFTVISRLAGRLPEPESPAQARYIQKAVETAQELAQMCLNITEEIRAFLWFPSEESAAEFDADQQAQFADLQERWQPYDEQSWTTLITGLMDFAAPMIQELRVRAAHLDAHLRHLAAETGDDEQLQSMVETIRNELAAIGEPFTRFKDLMDIDKLIYRPEQNQWESA